MSNLEFNNNNDNNEGTVTWSWDFGDETFGSGKTINHIYYASGTYDVTLTLHTQNASFSKVKSGVVYASASIVFQDPSANFHVDTPSGVTGREVTFYNDTLGDALGYELKFGDRDENGEFIVSAFSDPFISCTHVYSGLSEYFTPELTAYGITPGIISVSSRQDYIYTSAINPTSLFSADTVTGFEPLTVQFTNESIGDAQGYIWNFGDLQISNELNPIHTYQSDGVYTVTLRSIAFPNGTDSLAVSSNFITVYNIAAPTPLFVGEKISNGSYQPQTWSFSDSSIGVASGWLWEFGDGNTMYYTRQSLVTSGYTPTTVPILNEYSSAGSFDVTLTLAGVNGAGSGIATSSNYVVVPDGIPNVTFSATPVTGEDYVTCQFSATVTGPILSLRWDYGDGQSYTPFGTPVYSDFTPIHIYPRGVISEGTGPTQFFSPKLTVYGPAGSKEVTREDYISVTHASDPDTITFSGTPLTGNNPLTVQFDSSSTGVASNYKWNFSGGTLVMSTEADPQYTYQTSGTYSVNLSAYDSQNNLMTYTRAAYVTVDQSQVVPSFSANVLGGVSPLTVQFTDTTDYSQLAPLNRLWTFGNGLTSSTANPTVVYTNNTTSLSSFDVTLVVTTEKGTVSEIKDDYITVYPLVGNTTNFQHNDRITFIEHELPVSGDVIPFYIQSVVPVNYNDYDPAQIRWGLKDSSGNACVCQTQVVATDYSGGPRSVEIIARMPAQTGKTPGVIYYYDLFATSSVAPIPGAYSPTLLTGMPMLMTAPAFNTTTPLINFSADILTPNNTKIFRNGPYCKTYEYYNRLDVSGGSSTVEDEKAIGVTTFVSYFSGEADVQVETILSRMHMNPSGTTGNDFDAAKTIYFDQLTVSSPTGYRIAQELPRANSTTHANFSSITLCSSVLPAGYNEFLGGLWCVRRFTLYPPSGNLTRSLDQLKLAKLAFPSDTSTLVNASGISQNGGIVVSSTNYRAWNTVSRYRGGLTKVPKITDTWAPVIGNANTNWKGKSRVKQVAKDEYNISWASLMGSNPTPNITGKAFLGSVGDLEGPFGLFTRIDDKNGNNTGGGGLYDFIGWHQNRWVSLILRGRSDCCMDREGNTFLDLSGNIVWDFDFSAARVAVGAASAVPFKYTGSTSQNQFAWFTQTPSSFNTGSCPYETLYKTNRQARNFEHFIRATAPVIETVEYTNDPIARKCFESYAARVKYHYTDIAQTGSVGTAGNTIVSKNANVNGIYSAAAYREYTGPESIDRTEGRSLPILVEYFNFCKPAQREHIYNWILKAARWYYVTVGHSCIWNNNRDDGTYQSDPPNDAFGANAAPYGSIPQSDGTYLAYGSTKHHSMFTPIIAHYYMTKFLQQQTATGRYEVETYNCVASALLTACKNIYFGDCFILNGSIAGTNSPGAFCGVAASMAAGASQNSNASIDYGICKGDTNISDPDPGNTTTTWVSGGLFHHAPNANKVWTPIRHFGSPNGAGNNGSGYPERWLSGVVNTYLPGDPHYIENTICYSSSSTFFSGIHPFQGERSAWPLFFFSDPFLRTEKTIPPAPLAIIGKCCRGKGTWSLKKTCISNIPAASSCDDPGICNPPGNDPGRVAVDNTQGGGFCVYIGADLMNMVSGTPMNLTNPFVKRALEWGHIFKSGPPKADWAQKETNTSEFSYGEGNCTNAPLFGFLQSLSGSMP